MNKGMVENGENKRFVKKNYKKILAIVGTVTIAGVSYMVYRNRSNLHKSIDELKNANHTLMAACSEGLFDEAIATTTRKLNYRQDKLHYISQRLINNPNDINALSVKASLNMEIEELSNRLDLFNAAQEIYKIEETSN